jgi:hypothetical protein
MLDAETRLLVKSAIQSLRSLQISLREYIEAVRVQKQASDDQHEQPLPLPVDLRTELPLPVAVREYYEAEQRDRPPLWWRRLKGGLEMLGVSAAIAVAVFTGLTLRQISTQTETLEAGNRPWLKIVDVILDDSIPNAPILSFSPIGTVPKTLTSANLRSEFRIRNIGNRVAQNISINPDIVFEPWNSSTDVIESGERSSCEPWIQERSRLPSAFTWSAIFPGDEVRYRIAVAKPFEETVVNHIPGRPGNYLSGVLVGCVTYQFPKRYQTRAVFHVMGPTDRFIEIDKSLDSPQIHLLRDEHYEHAQ